MKDDHQSLPKQKDISQPATNSQPSQGELIPPFLSAEPVDDMRARESTQKTARNLGIVIGIVVVIGVGLAVGLVLTVSQATSTKLGTSKSSDASSSTGQSIELPASGGSGTSKGQNPATGNAGVGSEGKYCSNPYNAALTC